MFQILNKLEDPKRPLLGPNIKALKFWGLILPDSKIKKYFYLIMHLLVTIFTATEYVDVWFVKTDINLLLNNLKITMLATVSVCKVSTFLYWQDHWKSIIQYVTKADLNQRVTRDENKIQLLRNSTKYCRKITFFYWSLMYTTVVIVIFQPIFKYLLSESYREGVRNGTQVYLQVVSSWVPFDKSTLFGYLSASIYQSYAAIYGGGWITSFDTNAMVIMVFFKSELELLRIDSSNIYSDDSGVASDERALKRMKDCHRRHVELVKFGRLFDSCLSPIMLLYMFVCSVMLCVTAYQITIEKSAMERFLTTEYLVFGVAQLFIYCWHSNDVLYAIFSSICIIILTTEYLMFSVAYLYSVGTVTLYAVSSQQLMLGPYESKWWTRPAKNRRDVHMLIAQFKKTVVFSAGPFTKLSVTTFISILKGAYSYYTILSQSQI